MERGIRQMRYIKRLQRGTSVNQALSEDTLNMALFLILAAAIVGALAEPPVDRQYLPPSGLSRQYGAPGLGGRGGSSFGSRGALSTQYGAPSAFGGLAARPGLSTQYGVPSTSSRFGAANGVSQQYGAPSGFGGSSGSALSRQYSAPGLNGFASRNALSTQYGVPSAFGGAGRLPGQFANNAVSAQYGAPSANGALAGANFGAGIGLSTQYGAPGGGLGFGRGGAQEDPLAEPANYEFNYSVEDAQSGNDFGHSERRQYDYAQGQYRVLLPDGRKQIVDYEADQEGYKPNIRYEDTGLGAFGLAGGYGRGRAGGYAAGGAGGYAAGGAGGYAAGGAGGYAAGGAGGYAAGGAGGYPTGGAGGYASGYNGYNNNNGPY